LALSYRPAAHRDPLSFPTRRSSDLDKSDNANSSDSSASDEARAFVLTDADALSDLIISQLVTNQLLLVDAVRWLGGEESFAGARSEEHTSELQSRENLVCRLLLEKK